MPVGDLPAYPSEDAVLSGVTVEMLKVLFPAAVAEITQRAAEQRNAALWSGKAAASDIAAGLTLGKAVAAVRSEEHTSELQSPCNLVCRLLLEKKKKGISECLRASSKSTDTAFRRMRRAISSPDLPATSSSRPRTTPNATPASTPPTQRMPGS